jgi:hypothetical protein
MFTWVTEDEVGTPVKESEEFESRDEAEAWMGAQWSVVAESGGHTVVLMQNAEVVYRMSLEPE